MKVADSSLLSEAHRHEIDNTSATCCKTLLWKRLQQVFITLYDAYLKVQIYNRRSYAIKQLRDFDRYCAMTSSWRILWLCMLTTLPGLVMATFFELIPLQSPLDTWDHQIVYWARIFVYTAMVSFVYAYQILPYIPDLQIQPEKIYPVAIITGIVVLGFSVVLAAHWTFPVPFMQILATIPFATALIPLLYMLLKKIGYDGSPHQIRALKRQIVVSSIHGIELIAYNGYNAIFQLLSQTEQFFFIGLLPLLKFSLKSLYAWAMRDEQEHIPELITFNVEVFHALFVSICMQTAKSIWASTLLIGIDAFQALLSVLEMGSDSKALLQAFKQYRTANASDEDLMSCVLDLCQKVEIRQIIQVRGGDKCLQSTQPKAKIGPSELGIDGLVDRTSGLDSGCGKKVGGKQANQSKIHPVKIQQMKTTTILLKVNTKMLPLVPMADKEINLQKHLHHEQKDVELVSEALKLLFHVEYCMMTELVEVAIPIVYTVHTSVLFYLPNAIYYSHTRNMTFEELKVGAANILLYALIEAIVLFAFHYTLQRRFRFSPMRLLGYSLETQWRQVTARSTASICFILQLTLMHHGVDFEFKFNWAEQLGINRNKGL